DVTAKEGRGGALVFVTVEHAIAGGDGSLALREEQDIVYRGASQPGSSPAPKGSKPEQPPSWTITIAPDPVMLFRYSAVTFNGHRIHYDRSYVTEVEGYPGLVVHGPLTATLLLEMLRRKEPESAPARFAFRAQRPLFDTAQLTVAGRRDHGTYALWALDSDGLIAMEATATVTS
ncbi:MAG: acyl-CoA dehydrogenase, partial [Candidatus Eremiobacteraeota bacterium]|nr:acyl-CoA dehydrogenase [Candidatus Eremiobacteraeota bacterium]